MSAELVEGKEALFRATSLLPLIDKAFTFSLTTPPLTQLAPSLKVWAGLMFASPNEKEGQTFSLTDGLEVGLSPFSDWAFLFPFKTLNDLSQPASKSDTALSKGSIFFCWSYRKPGKGFTLLFFSPLLSLFFRVTTIHGPKVSSD